MHRALAVYLILYFLAVGGAAVTVWRAGLIDYLHHGWTATVFVVALLLGLALALLSRK